MDILQFITLQVLRYENNEKSISNNGLFFNELKRAEIEYIHLTSINENSRNSLFMN